MSVISGERPYAVVAERLLESGGRSAELRFEVAAVLHAELVHEVGGEEGVPAADEDIVGDVIVAEARDTIAGGGLGKRAVRRVPAEVVVLERDVIAVVDLPVELGKEDDLAGGARHKSRFTHEAGDELLILLERITGQRHAEALAQCFEIGRRERVIEEVSDVAGARDSGKVAAELVVGEEPEDAVGADGAAGGDSPLLAIVRRGDGDSGHGTVGLQLRELREGIASAPGIVAIEQEGVAVQMVGAAAGDSVDDTAGGAAVFGGVVRGVDLKLAHGGLTGEVGGAGAAALLGEEGLVVVCAIEGVVVEKNADAAKAELAIALLVRRDRGGEQREVGPPAAVRRQLIDGGLVDVGGECGRAQVNDGSGLADFDGLLGMRDGEVRGQRSEAAHLYRDACDVETREAVCVIHAS